MEQPKPNFTISPEMQAKIDKHEYSINKTKKSGKRQRKEGTPMTKEENESIKVLLDEPIVFECPTRWRRFIGIKTSKWSVRYQPYETLVRLGREYGKLFFDEDDIQKFGIEEAKRLSVDQSMIFARIAAIAVTGTMPFESIIRPLLTQYFFKRLHPRLMVQLCVQLNKQGDYADFILSIRLTHGRRLTEPALIDQDKEG